MLRMLPYLRDKSSTTPRPLSCIFQRTSLGSDLRKSRVERCIQQLVLSSGEGCLYDLIFLRPTYLMQHAPSSQDRLTGLARKYESIRAAVEIVNTKVATIGMQGGDRGGMVFARI